jgi:hypothetical protein
MLGYVGSLILTSKLSHEMCMVHLTKCQIIIVNLIKGQIRMVNLIKPYPFNMANWIKPHGHFDGHLSILTKSLTWHLVKKITLVKCIGQM